MGVIFKNNVMYGAGDIEISPVCYSEEEREVGCWVDGKPLYEKTVIWDNPTLGRVDNLSHGIENVDHIHMTNWQFGVVFGFESTDASYWANIFNVTNTGVSYRIGGAWGSGAKPLIITFQYTKTTDTPGSGIWTPSGVPAVHYSTSEQVVGTWVDGKTLYQKTLYVASGQIYSSTGISMPTQNNIDRLISYSGSVYDSNDQRIYALPYERLMANEGIWVSCHVLSDHSLTPVVFTRQSSTYNLSDIYVTIRYTKTTT